MQHVRTHPVFEYAWVRDFTWCTWISITFRKLCKYATVMQADEKSSIKPKHLLTWRQGPDILQRWQDKYDKCEVSSDIKSLFIGENPTNIGNLSNINIQFGLCILTGASSFGLVWANCFCRCCRSVKNVLIFCRALLLSCVLDACVFIWDIPTSSLLVIIGRNRGEMLPECNQYKSQNMSAWTLNYTFDRRD